MLHLRYHTLILCAVVLSILPAEARNHAWFVKHIKPGSQCSGHPMPTTYYSEGRRNADGSRFNRNEYSAASWDYPFGTILNVTNCNNGRSVRVVIKDRGPARYIYNMGIRLDLSLGAARAIALGQHGRFESGYTTHSVISLGSGESARRHRKSRRARSVVVDVAARPPYPL